MAMGETNSNLPSVPVALCKKRTGARDCGGKRKKTTGGEGESSSHTHTHTIVVERKRNARRRERES
jgi:hypothetical protein